MLKNTVQLEHPEQQEVQTRWLLDLLERVRATTVSHAGKVKMQSLCFYHALLVCTCQSNEEYND